MVTRAREKLLRRLGRRTARSREGLFVVEGVRAAAEALDAGLAVEFALCAPGLDEGERGRALAARLAAAGVGVERVSDRELARFADTEAPQGILLVCAQPRRTLADLAVSALTTLLVCDALQDPGNLGALIRSAAAFGAAGVVALDGTVDAWNPKAVRASAGAAFRLPLVPAPWSAAGGWLAEHGFELWVADARGEDVEQVGRRGPVALVIGNEGSGVRREIKAAAARTVAVPVEGRVESLNAAIAGSILLYRLARTVRHA